MKSRLWRICVPALVATGLSIAASAELGRNWTAAREYTLWSAPIRHTSVVFHDKIWVIGGQRGSYLRNDVWCSSDGATWTLVTWSAPWANRHSHTSVVHGGRLWVVGGVTDRIEYLNDIWSSPDGTSWTRVTASAPWAGRAAHTSVVHDGKIWVIGGYDGDTYRNDVWYSSDGISWTQATDGAPWSGRLDHTSVVEDGKIWVIGGYYRDGRSHYLNDVWYSSDGTSWTRASAAAAWSTRYRHSSVVHDGKLWVMGGYNYYDGDYHIFNDVWCSSNGTSWTALTRSAAWAARGEHSSLIYHGEMWIIGRSMSASSDSGVWHSSDGVNWIEAPGRIWSARWSHTSVVHDGKMWVLGGEGGHGAWTSPDGRNWTETTYFAPWDFRTQHTSVVHDGKIWVIGGKTWNLSNDVWYSTDGRIWTSATLAAPWSARYGHASAVYGGRIWVLGGDDGTNPLNDVWSSPDGSSWTLETASAPWPPQSGHAAVVHDGNLYLIGQHIEYLPPPTGAVYAGDAWCYDGVDWTRTTDWAPWEARTGHTVVSCAGRMWLMGGCIQVIYWDAKVNDVWSSPDGANWTLVTPWADWSIRDEHTSVVFDNKIWVLGGFYNGDRYNPGYPVNDIWYSEAPYWTAAPCWQRYH